MVHLRVPFGSSLPIETTMARARTGTMTERGPGRWRLQVTPIADPLTGKRRRVSRTVIGTRAEARQALQRFAVENSAGLVGNSTNTVETLLDAFMATATLAPTTREDWQSLINRHIVPQLGAIPLWRFTARDCDRFYTRLREPGIGPSRVRCAHVILHRAVSQAVRWGWITHNPVAATTRPAVPRVTIRPPTAEQVRAVIGRVEPFDAVFACWLKVAVATGARRGEICALRWSDIDLDLSTVRIERSVSVTKNGGVAFTTTKTGNVRLVTLTTQAIDALAAHRAHTQNQLVGAIGEAAQVFTNDPTGVRPWRPDLATRRWRHHRGAVGLDHVRLHDLHHFVATELLTAGIDVRTVSNRLGHARTSTTLDIYWAWVPAQDRHAAHHLQTVLSDRRHASANSRTDVASAGRANPAR